MESFFRYDNEKIEKVDKINLDELYSKKQEEDKSKLYTYNKILVRIHNKIKLTSRQKNSEHCCWYVVPEMILGVANYDHAGCIQYIVSKLLENKFVVRYTHPNLLFISWRHYVPSYVRTEIKKKTGVIVDEYGVAVDQAGGGSGSGGVGISSDSRMITMGGNNGGGGGGGSSGGGIGISSSPEDLNALLYNPKLDGLNKDGQQQQQQQQPNKKEYTPINTYRPTGNLVYDDDLFNKIVDKFS